MNRLKWNLVSMVLLTLISTGSPASSRYGQQQQKRDVSMASANQSPYWEHILREFVFKTISPPPPGNNDLYKLLLDAPFYSGPFPIISSNSTNAVLSRGNVYYLPNDSWLLCQEGCTDCEVCNQHTHPTVKWILRRIKRVTSHGSPRFDHQMTIIPQMDGSYHMRNLWPRSYVYVTTQGEMDAYLTKRLGYQTTGSAIGNLEDTSSGQQQRKSNNFWRFVERNTLVDRHVPGERNNATREPVEIDSGGNIETTVKPAKDNKINESKDTSKSARRQRTRLENFDKPVNGSSVPVRLKDYGKRRIKQVVPKIILGTDQLGKKHLIHVVPADSSGNGSLVNFGASSSLNSADGQYNNKSAYHWILNRIFDSLNSNRRSIENFLEPLTQSARTNQQVEEHQQQETRSGFTGLGQMDRLYRAYGGGIRSGTTMQKRWPFVLNWNRPRRKSINSNNFISNLTNTGFTERNNCNWVTDMESVSVNSTCSNGKTIENVSDHRKLRLIAPKFSNNSYYDRNVFNNNNNNMTTGNFSRKNQENKFGTRKYKFVVTTESTTKPSSMLDLKSNYDKNTGNKGSPLISGNNSILLNTNKNLYRNLNNTIL